MEVRREKMFLLYSCMTQTRMLNIDFSRIDSPEIKELRDRIRRDNNWEQALIHYSGKAMQYYMDFLILLSNYYWYPSYAFYDNFWEKLHYYCTSCTCCNPFTTMKASIYFKKKTLQFMFGKIKEEDKEDIVSFGWDFVSGNGYNYKNGKDIRIYKSYKLMERWCTDAFHNKNSVKN